MIADFFADIDWVHSLTIPIFTGVVGWLINWSGLVMLFSPVHFRGVRIPGMRELAGVLPRRLQEVPDILQGGIGVAGDHPGPRRQDGEHRRRQGDRQARDAG